MIKNSKIKIISSAKINGKNLMADVINPCEYIDFKRP